MAKKTEIKVYLPTKMVGELESRKRAGVRSKFIRDAIRFKLNGEEEYDIADECDAIIIDECVVRMRALRLRDETKFNEDLAAIIWRFLR